MYSGTSLFSHNRGIPKPNPDLVPHSGPFLALWSGSELSPEFRTLVVPLKMGAATQSRLFSREDK